MFAQGGSVTLINDTITSNTANTGGGIYVASAATLSLGNCIVAQNTATSGIDPDSAPPTTSSPAWGTTSSAA